MLESPTRLLMLLHESTAHSMFQHCTEKEKETEEQRTSSDVAARSLENVREDQRGSGNVIGKNASQESGNAAEPIAKLFTVIPRYLILICVLHWHVQHSKRHLVFLVVTRSIHASAH